MKITVIRVSMFEGKSHDAMKPLIFPIISGLTPKMHQINFLDDRIEELPNKLSSDIIALSADTFSAKRAYILAKKYKTENNIIVMGGFHATILPQECQVYVDVVIIGDAEDTWPRLLHDYENGKLQKKYISEYQAPLSYIPSEHPAYEGKRYQRIGTIQFSRGCKYHCDFCSIKSMYPCNIQQKDIKCIIEEVKDTKETILFFIDDNLFMDKSSAIALFKAIKPLKKKWACQVSMDIALHDELLASMKESGCILVLIGFESLNRRNLELMNKSANLRQSYDEVIANIYKHKLMIYATFVLGYDYDTPETIRETMQFAMKHKFAVANFNPLIPMPGTKLYERLAEQGRLLYPKWWLQEGYCYGDTVYQPMKLSPEELRDLCKEVRFQYYSFINIVKRFIGNKIHRQWFRCGAYFILNIVSALEIRRKQGRLLGGISDEADIN